MLKKFLTASLLPLLMCASGCTALMTNLTPHCSTPNETDIVRWSVDVRYQGADVPNNIATLPNIEHPPSDEVLMACYPPEADFVVQSRRDPARVASYETYLERRNHFDRVRQKAYPQRHWTPVAAGT